METAEPLVEEPKVGAVEGPLVDQFLTEENIVKGLIDVVRMVMEEGEREDAALRVHEADPKEEEVRNGVRYDHALGMENLPQYCRRQVFLALVTFAEPCRYNQSIHLKGLLNFFSSQCASYIQ